MLARALRDRYWVDHRARIDFYVEHGLLARAPTDEQIAQSFAEYGQGGGVIERVVHYLQHRS